MKKILFLKLFFLTLLTSWGQSPGVRNGHAMVYHVPLKSTVLFGGADAEKVNGDTWILRDFKWSKLSIEGPSARTFGAMVSTDNGVLLFGGNTVLFGGDANPPIFLNDTWMFKGGGWIQQHSENSPPGRAEASIAFDPVRGVAILFGGYRLDSLSKPIRLSDTWEFDGKQWAKIEGKGPSRRSGASMIYNNKLKECILFGGNISALRDSSFNGPVWSWNGVEWKNLPTDNLNMLYNACIAHNSADGMTLRFGGWDGKVRLDQTSTFIAEQNQWKMIPMTGGPLPRNHATMVYDSEKNLFLLFGGHNGTHVFGDIWTFKGRRWEMHVNHIPIERIKNGH